MAGSIFMGLVVDKIGSKVGCIVNMICVVIVWAVSFMQIQANKDNIWIVSTLPYEQTYV